MWSIFHLPDPNRSLEKWLFLNAEQHLAFIQSISGYWYGPRVKETEGKFSQWWNDGARAFWRGARKWIRHKHRDKEPRVVINNPGGGRGSTVRTLQPTWDIISRLQHLLEDMPLPHPTESIYIDSAFEQSMWVSPQVEPNYSETPQEGSASGRMIISWLDWENKTKLRQINNDGKAAVSGGAGSDESRMKEGRSNVTPGRGVFWMRPCCLRFRNMSTTCGHDERVSSSYACLGISHPRASYLSAEHHFESLSSPTRCWFLIAVSRSLQQIVIN